MVNGRRCGGQKGQRPDCPDVSETRIAHSLVLPYVGVRVPSTKLEGTLTCDGVWTRTPLSDSLSEDAVSMSDELKVSLLLASRSSCEMCDVGGDVMSLSVSCVMIMSLSLSRSMPEGHDPLSRC